MSLLNLQDLLDETLDGVEAAPEMVSFPSGEYILNIAKATPSEYPAKEDTPAGVKVVVVYKCVETVQLDDPAAQEVPEGSITTESFRFSPEGVKYFKTFINNIMGAAAAGVSRRELIANLEGLNIKCIVRGGKFTNTSRQLLLD